MKVVVIPVSPLSLRIIRHEFGHATPLRLPTHSNLLKQLHYRPTMDAYKQRQQHSLTASLSVAVHDRLAAQITEHRGAIGYYIFDQHKRRIFREVLAQSEAGNLGRRGARGCLQDILLRYQIEEDDYALDTAERLWKRWRKERENRLLNHASSVPRNTTQLYEHQLSETQARRVASRMMGFIDDQVISFDNRSRASLLPYLLYTFTKLKQKEVANKLGVHQQSVDRSCSRMRGLIAQSDDLLLILAYCLKTTKAVPVPNLAS